MEPDATPLTGRSDQANYPTVDAAIAALDNWLHGNYEALLRFLRPMESELTPRHDAIHDAYQEIRRLHLGRSLRWDGNDWIVESGNGNLFGMFAWRARWRLLDGYRRQREVPMNDPIGELGLEQQAATVHDTEPAMILDDPLRDLRQQNPSSYNCVYLCDMNGFTEPEAADLLGLSRPQVYRRRAVGVSFLRSHLIASGHQVSS